MSAINETDVLAKAETLRKVAATSPRNRTVDLNGDVAVIFYCSVVLPDGRTCTAGEVESVAEADAIALVSRRLADFVPVSEELLDEGGTDTPEAGLAWASSPVAAVSERQLTFAEALSLPVQIDIEEFGI